MNTLNDGTRVRGLPPWMLAAASPLVLVLGVVAGVALSAYWPGAQVQPAPPTTAEDPHAPGAESGAPVTNTPGDEVPSAQLEPTQSVEPAPAQETAGLLPPPFDFWSDPTEGPATGGGSAPIVEVKTLVDARAVLTAEYGAFVSGGRERFRVDYQLARDENYDTMLVGIIKMADFNEWVSAVRNHRDELNRWLRSAAQRVQAAAVTDGFTLTWAIFEVVPDRPYGFLASEVTPTPKGDGYLVTRPLAAVTDVPRSIVSIASTDIGGGPQTAAGPPANVYGPVLRFDPTDLYRPTQQP